MHILEPLSNVIVNTRCADDPICAPFTFYITCTHKDRVKTLLTFASGLPQVFETNLCSIWSSRIWGYFVSPSTHWTLGYCRRKAPASYWMPREWQHRQSTKRFHNKHFHRFLMTRAAGINLDDRGDELFKEVVVQQWWPVMMDEVDEKTLNVRSVLILQKSPNIIHTIYNYPIFCNRHTVYSLTWSVMIMSLP